MDVPLSAVTEPLWQPSAERIGEANLTAFAAQVRSEWGVEAPDYASLHRWSIEAPEAFWQAVWSFCGVIGDGGDGRVVDHADQMPGAVWFPEARLNFAENLLRRRDDSPALIFQGEDQVRRISCSGCARRCARGESPPATA
jgi:acetoacetyl-CoA synthetase